MEGIAEEIYEINPVLFEIAGLVSGYCKYAGN